MNAQRIFSIIAETQLEGTIAAYDPKQEEFQEFCHRKQYQDGETVTEEKLLLFLVEEVTDRLLRKRSRKAATGVAHEKMRLSWRSVRSYVSAVTDLYRTQKLMGMNCYSSLQVENVWAYFKSLQ